MSQTDANDDLVYLFYELSSAFVAFGRQAALGADDEGAEEDPDFYLKFYQDVYTLQIYVYKLYVVHAGFRVDVESRKHIERVLTALSPPQRRLVGSLAPNESKAAVNMLRRLRQSAILTTDKFKELRSLRKRIQEEENATDEYYVTLVKASVDIGGMDEKRRKQLSSSLNDASQHFISLFSQPPTYSPNSVSLVKYPSHKIWDFASPLYRLLKKHWEEGDEPQPSKLSLTAHRHFETESILGTVPHYRSATFQMLLHAPYNECKWQDAEICLKGGDCCGYDLLKSRVQRDLSGVVRTTKKKEMLKLLGYECKCKGEQEEEKWKLWRLQVDWCQNFDQIRSGEFPTLKKLLGNQGGHENVLGRLEERGRLLLSFVIATTVVHLYQSPWLRELRSDTVCFLRISRYRLDIDLAKPYLMANIPNPGATSTAPHDTVSSYDRFPLLRDLGILLLEIAQCKTMEFGDRGPNGIDALERFQDWTRKTDGSLVQTVSPHLKHAIESCLDRQLFPESFRARKYPEPYDVRQHIFRDVVIPLAEALAESYEIPQEKLTHEITRPKEFQTLELFDHSDETATEKRDSADKWYEFLDGLHSACEEVNDAPRGCKVGAERVRIAVLDTGFEPPDTLMVNYEAEGRINVAQSRSFLAKGEETAGEVNKGLDWRKDSNGHGTCVGQILLDVAPMADIHIARVFESGKDLSNPELAPQVQEKISQAIAVATKEWEVDIIVMSFGFESSIPIIDKAIEKALEAKKKPLLFAATRNHGAHLGVAWPARHGNVIAVSSTDGDGIRSTFNPPDHSCSHKIFYALGEGVKVSLADPNNPRSKFSKRVSATSYANPAAAGLAAMLLWFVRRALREPPSDTPEGPGYDTVIAGLRTSDGMRAVLKECMTKEGSLLPWAFLTEQKLRDHQLLRNVYDALKYGK